MTHILQLKITLEESKPEIWRKFLVEDSINFKKLHAIIQIIMGWENYHLYDFQIDKNTYVESSENEFTVDSVWTDFKMPGKRKTYRDDKTKLSDLIIQKGQKFLYTYDFGDSWTHIIKVENILPKENGKKYPICVDGAMSCPPEDCGGIWGYEELMQLKKKPDDPEYEELIIDWLGEDFDPEYFSAEDVNKQLRDIRYDRCAV